jgi:mevalonate kinase
MPVIFGKAPGKIILFGEHAVVYGQPAIAMPVSRVNATARVTPNISAAPGLVRLVAPDIDLDAPLDHLSEDHPLASAVRMTLAEVSPHHTPAFTIQIDSTIPIAAGMGSGAAVTVAIIRALSAFLGRPLSDSRISELAFEVEKIHHGTPSGIDNTVIAYGKPVYFQKEMPTEILQIEKPTHWVIADSGEKTPTKTTVAAVRDMYENDPLHYGQTFDRIGAISEEARPALITGDLKTLGRLMNENQTLLNSLQVGSEKLDRLCQAALDAGALGAKLSGGGRGGNMIALAAQENCDRISQVLAAAGAAQTIVTTLRETVP